MKAIIILATLLALGSCSEPVEFQYILTHEDYKNFPIRGYGELIQKMGEEQGNRQWEEMKWFWWHHIQDSAINPRAYGPDCNGSTNCHRS